MDALIAWIVAHQAVVAGAVVGIMDLVIELIPSLAGNGILSQILVFAKKIAAPKPPASSV